MVLVPNFVFPASESSSRIDVELFLEVWEDCIQSFVSAEGWGWAENDDEKRGQLLSFLQDYN